MVNDWSAVTSLQVKVLHARDKFLQTCKKETALNKWSADELRQRLLVLVDFDASESTRVVKFVFPNSTANRETLDRALEINSQAKTEHSRPISKRALDIIASAKEPITVEQAVEKAKAEKIRTPGGQTNQTSTGTGTGALTEDEQLETLYCAALAFAKKHGYDAADAEAVYEMAKEKISLSSPEEEKETETETE